MYTRYIIFGYDVSLYVFCVQQSIKYPLIETIKQFQMLLSIEKSTLVSVLNARIGTQTTRRKNGDKLRLFAQCLQLTTLTSKF